MPSLRTTTAALQRGPDDPPVKKAKNDQRSPGPPTLTELAVRAYVRNLLKSGFTYKQIREWFKDYQLDHITSRYDEEIRNDDAISKLVHNDLLLAGLEEAEVFPGEIIVTIENEVHPSPDIEKGNDQFSDEKADAPPPDIEQNDNDDEYWNHVDWQYVDSNESIENDVHPSPDIEKGNGLFSDEKADAPPPDIEQNDDDLYWQHLDGNESPIP